MPTHDPTGEPIEQLTAEEHREEIRKRLCLGPDQCSWDHEHTAGEDQDQPIETIDPKENL